MSSRRNRSSSQPTPTSARRKHLFYPTISLTGFLGAVSGDLTSFLGGTGGVWSLSPSLFQPIFQAGRIRRNLEAAHARFDAALAGYQKAALNGYREVANALVTIQKLAEQRARRETESRRCSTRPISPARGTTPDSPVISNPDRRRQLFEQQLLLAETHGAELRARAELYRALGGGWQPQP